MKALEYVRLDEVHDELPLSIRPAYRRTKRVVDIALALLILLPAGLLLMAVIAVCIAIDFTRPRADLPEADRPTRPAFRDAQVSLDVP